MILTAPFTLTPGAIDVVSTHAIIKNCFFVCYNLTSLVDISPVGFQSYVFREPISLAGVLKVGTLEVGSKPFTPWGKAKNSGFPLNCTVLCQGQSFAVRVSQPFQPF